MKMKNLKIKNELNDLIKSNISASAVQLNPN